MNTVVDISLIVGIAAALTFISAMVVVYLLRTTTERFRFATFWYAGSTFSLVLAVCGVLGAGVLPYALAVVVIIGGALFGIIFAYAAVRQSNSRAMWWKPVIGFAVLATLAQGFLAWTGASVVTLMVTSSLINGPVSLLIAFDLFRRFKGPRNGFSVLFGWPFLAIGAVYLLRLMLLTGNGGDTAVILSTAVIAFCLGIASMYWGFVLIIQREAALNSQLITARRNTEVLAEQQARFFAQMNHEIRTPLNGILGIAELLKPHVRAADGAKLIRELQGSGQLLLSIVNEVLEYSKASAGKIVLESLPIDLEELLENVTAQHRRVATSRNIQLSLHVFPADLPPVLGDPTRINQIMQNLLSNALKFTHTGDIAVTALRDPAGQMVITVRDTGIGMTQEQLSTLFAPFQQASADTTRRFGGTGLGMSIVKMLVETMQGSIHAASEPGRGTTITITLPLPEAPLPTNDQDNAQGSKGVAGQFPSLRLLCADDDPINRLVLEALLQGYGITPVMASDGFEAVTLAQKQDFDAYVIDISMPGMDGVETLATLRDADQRMMRAQPMAIAATAHVISDDVQAYLQAGFDRHLAKPIRREDLEQMLQAIVMRASQLA